MQARPRIVVADRSALASNLYQILFAPLEARIVVRRRLDDALWLLLGRERTELAILSTNTMGKAIEEAAARIEADASLSRAQKLFLASGEEAQGPAGARLAALPHSTVLSRPFHPEEFLAHVRKQLTGRGA